MHDDTSANEKRKLKLRFQNIFSKCFHLHVWCRRRCYVLDAAIRSDGMRESEASAHGVAKYYLDKRETSCSTVVWTANKIRQLCEFYFFANFFSLFFLLFLGQIHFVVSSYWLCARRRWFTAGLCVCCETNTKTSLRRRTRPNWKMIKKLLTNDDNNGSKMQKSRELDCAIFAHSLFDCLILTLLFCA